MKEKDDKKKKKMIIDAVVMAVVAGIIALIIFLITYKKETHIYESYDEGKTAALVCTTSSNDSAFFEGSADKLQHMLKLVYYNGTIGKMSYEYTGEYDSNESARHDDAILHAKYNTYMGEHDTDSWLLTPVFQVSDNKLDIKLYLDGYEKMNSVIGKLFYINSASLGTVAKNSLEETKKYYEKKNFSCIISE